MSIVADQVRRIDTQLDRIQLLSKSATSSPQLAYRTLTNASTSSTNDFDTATISPRIEELQTLIKAFSTTSSKALLSAYRISLLLNAASLSDTDVYLTTSGESRRKSDYEKELEWLLISKATAQTYGLILNTLLEQTIPLAEDVWYWDEVLGSYAYTALYTAQTSPINFFNWSKEIYHDATERFNRLRQPSSDSFSTRAAAQELGDGALSQWRAFYHLVRESIRERSIMDIQSRLLTPLSKSRSSARRKQAHLRRLREMSASGLGLMMDEGLSFPPPTNTSSSDDGYAIEAHEWKGVVERSVALMDTVLSQVSAVTSHASVHDFEDCVFSAVEEDPEISSRSSGEPSTQPAKLAQRLQKILDQHIPAHLEHQAHLRAQYGRPGILTRYWLPATALLLSSTTILRLLLNRKAALLQYIRDLGQTVQDFYLNWVVTPSKKILKTIRHSEESEVALMSRESLKGDRESLERMVVEFAIDNPSSTGQGGMPLTEGQIEGIRRAVKEGDLTPVLRAYEKDLRNPILGTLRGDLVRTVLIQVQKTKVDVEVALSGIDALLKSQELVFGFIGLTPGLLVSFAVSRYLSSLFGRRGSRRSKKRSGRMIGVLRNIDRLLSNAKTGRDGMLGYKDHGLLVCEVHVLREMARGVLRGEVEREFLEDVAELGDVSRGVEGQRRCVERVRWGYGRWLG